MRSSVQECLRKYLNYSKSAFVLLPLDTSAGQEHLLASQQASLATDTHTSEHYWATPQGLSLGQYASDVVKQDASVVGQLGAVAIVVPLFALKFVEPPRWAVDE
jgi:hypothetical protein